MTHDGGSTAIVSVHTVATWPKGSFAESVAVDADGEIFVSLHTDQAVVRVDPANGAVTPFATFDRPATGLVFARDGALIVSGGAPGSTPGVVWRVERDGAVRPLAEIADAAFLNGLTPLGNRMLIADSVGATIYAIDPVSGAVERWLTDPLLGVGVGQDGPGANGLKIFGGAAIVSVTGSDRLVRVPINDGKAGRCEIIAENLRADDFAIGASGALYIATHQAQSLVRLAPDGTRTTLAGAEHGMVGSTAVAFGRTDADRTAIYVTTTGGTWTVPEERMEEAKLLRLDVGEPGHVLLDDR
jgi:sugar lactone lactonase YvrE